MFKIIMIAVTSLSFIGCSTTVSPKIQKQETKKQEIEKKHIDIHKAHKKEMFQTVNPQDATLVQGGDNKHSCTRCGMNLVKFYKTSHTAVDNDTKVQYCSIHCLAEHLDAGNELKNPTVVDVSSLKMIPVLQAYYVVGSKKKGTMSRVSKYAFKTLEDAKAFQQKNGGKILDFYGALELAREDFE